MEFSFYTVSRVGLFNKLFEISNETEVLYRIRKTNFFSLREFIFFDKKDEQCLIIKRPFNLFKKSFIIIQDEKILAEIDKDFIKNFFQVSSMFGNITMSGNFFSSDYSINRDVTEIAKVSRKRFKRKGMYGIAINDKENQLFILGLVFVVVLSNILKKKRS